MRAVKTIGIPNCSLHTKAWKNRHWLRCTSAAEVLQRVVIIGQRDLDQRVGTLLSIEIYRLSLQLYRHLLGADAVKYGSKSLITATLLEAGGLSSSGICLMCLATA